MPMNAIPALDLRALRKTYPNGVEALKGIDLKVEAGDLFALLGPNGAGKSTLIGILASLVNSSGGEARVFDVSVQRERSRAMALLGVVPQEINLNQFEKLFDICVNEAGFYGVPRPVAKQRAEKYLNELRLWDKAQQPARNLSGGMKRRLMIARAMMNEPRVLILDEPTAGVDIEIRRSMWQFVRQINREGVTVILTTHYLEEAENLCRNVAIIDHGQIIEHTTVKALLTQIDVETFVLDLVAPCTQQSLPHLEGLILRRMDESTLEVELPRGRDLNTLFAALSTAGLVVRSMRTKSNRLEELFLRLTGATERTA
ncbi:MAG: ABC transporter ATP-binding protein [Metallibacterium scheffleri]|jgi:ABC-2 type transport system ATP-binding protein|uniref:ABC transporter ATP-binding protein n=1 Tax=Metallibacterium scheffleri TaxID=993689 RepID=UPI0026EF72BE|nr:ABC transporter ATP-binding protein [Metallibacterium scheffleri]MCK9366534.1 ABC transporter ATP-binding protein [Metallibacterium scheffleri]